MLNITNADSKRLIIKEIPRLRRYARSLCNNREDADDLVQATLERALSKLLLWRSGTSMRGWLLTIMHNLRVNDLKKNSRESALQRDKVNLDDIEEIASDPACKLSILDIEVAMARLSEDHREVLLLVAMEQFSYKEAAQILGISKGTVMSRLFRARKHLHQLLYRNEKPAVEIRRIK